MKLIILINVVLGQTGMCFEANRQKPPVRSRRPAINTPSTTAAYVPGVVLFGKSFPSTNDALNYAMQVIQPPVTNSFQDECLYWHNIYRKILGLNPLHTSSEAISFARGYATHLSDNNLFEHSDSPMGENLYRGYSDHITCEPAMRAFFEEYKVYNEIPIGHGDFKSYGHFTQLAWPDTTSVGCSYAQKEQGGPITVACNYIPAGNVGGAILRKRIGNTFVQYE